MENKKVIHEGEITLGDYPIPCYVLEDGSRILSTSGMQRALGVIGNEPNQRSSKRLDEILTSKAVSRFIPNDLVSSKLKPISCTYKNKKINGYEAMVLPEICEIMLKVRDYADENNLELGIRQKLVIAQSDIIIRGLARVGIIALIDEATGYQYERERFELQKILNAYISDEILRWQITFTDDFYKEVYRLWGLPFIPKYIRNKPSFIGKLTNKYIYELLPKGVVDKIKENTGKTKGGHWKYKWHQSLTPEIGREHLKKQIIEVTTLMSVSQSKEQFDSLFQQKYNVGPVQLQLEFNENKEEEPLSDFNKKIKKGLGFNPNENKKKK